MSRQIIFAKSLAQEFRDVAADQRGRDQHLVVPEEAVLNPDRQGSGTAVPDDYSGRLVKYIPAEVITLFVTLNTIIAGAGDGHQVLLWMAFLFGTLATPLYLHRVARVRDRWHLAVSTGAFIVWVFALGGPFTGTRWYDPLYGAILLPIYTFLLPIFAVPPTKPEV